MDFKNTKLFDFSGTSALITGGATGLGAVMAQALVKNGSKVLIASRSEDNIQAKVQELNDPDKENCQGKVFDLKQEKSVNELAEHARLIFAGKMNIVVNCSGINVRNPLEDINLEEWEDIQRTNVTGAFLLAKAVLPLLKKATYGRLINVTSIFASRSFPHRLSYAASKGALLQLTRTLALEWASYGITVNAISPGPFLTEINKPVLDNPENYKQFCKNIPLGRFGNPEEIATTCLYLASPGSTYVTGSEVFIDGGWTAK